MARVFGRGGAKLQGQGTRLSPPPPRSPCATRTLQKYPSSTLHYTTLHYTTLHYTTLHYTTLHYTALHYTTLHYTTLHYTTLHYTTLHYSPAATGIAHVFWRMASVLLVLLSSPKKKP